MLQTNVQLLEPVMSDNKEDLADQFIGKKLKERRLKLSISQTQLAEILGVSYQLVQKYENGENRIPASRIYDLSKALNVSVSYFYEGLDKVVQPKPANIRTNINFTRFAPLKIMLVEDNPADELILIDAIEDSEVEHEIINTDDGQEALDKLKEFAKLGQDSLPDIILLDLNLPKRNGFEVLNGIKKDRDLMHLPVIVMTNSINVEELEKAYKNQACGFIGKSLDIDVFNYKIKIMLEYWSSTVVLPSMQSH